MEGSPSHPIEDLTMSNIRIEYRGGGTPSDAAIMPQEDPHAYPEPERHGKMPAYGLFARHVRGIELHDIHFSYSVADSRPAIVLQDVIGAGFRHVLAAHEKGVPVLVLGKSGAVTTQDVSDVPDLRLDPADPAGGSVRLAVALAKAHVDRLPLLRSPDTRLHFPHRECNDPIPRI